MARTKYYDETDGIWKYADTSGGTGPGGAVNSVNGKTGDVYLTAADVKARPDDWNPVVTTVIAPHGSGSKADMTASEIINAARKGVVLADYTDPKTGELRTYQYFKQMPDGRAVFAINGYIEAGTPKQTLIYVDYAGNVTTETKEATAGGIGAISATEKGAVNGVATLDAEGHLPKEQNTQPVEGFIYSHSGWEIKHPSLLKYPSGVVVLKCSVTGQSSSENPRVATVPVGFRPSVVVAGLTYDIPSITYPKLYLDAAGALFLLADGKAFSNVSVNITYHV